MPGSHACEWVQLIPALEDNYMYLLCDPATKQCAAVDPVEPQKVLAAVRERGWSLAAVLTTHSHWDHDGGNRELAGLVGSSVPIYGGRGDGAQAVTHEVGEGEVIKVGELAVSVLSIPCHTAGHVGFFAQPQAGQPGVVFTGDTLFVMGCGNLNNGTPQMMADAMVRLSQLPPETLAYVGHEYTLSNGEWATTVEPSEAVVAKLRWAREQRAAGLPTVPSTMGEEMETNPFLRAAVGLHDYPGFGDAPVARLAALRAHKSAGKWKAQVKL